MGNADAAFEQTLESLDRGVLLFALGGTILNIVEFALAGSALIVAAACTYGLLRNRITNLGHFEMEQAITPPAGVRLDHFTLICQWLGSRHLFDGLLSDLLDPEFHNSGITARQYLRSTLWPAIAQRTWQTVLARFWLGRD